MDHRRHIAHLLRHALMEISVECGMGCPIESSAHGGIQLRKGMLGNPSYEGPQVHIVLEAMQKMGYVVEMDRTGITVYYPTPLGSEFLKQFKHPRRYWFCQNWLPATVAAATIAIPIILKAMDIFLSSPST